MSDTEEKKDPSWDDPETRRVWTSLVGGNVAAKLFELAAQLQRFAERTERPECGTVNVDINVRGSITTRSLLVQFGDPGMPGNRRHATRAFELAEALVATVAATEEKWVREDEAAKAPQESEKA